MPIITKYYPRFPGQERKVRERYVVDENGVKQGLYQSYYRDGQDKVTCTYKDDVQHGHYISKHPNGRMAMECDYDEGALEGRVVRQDPKGMLLFDGHYHRNLAEGTQKHYQTDGKLHVLENWHLGTREGKSVTWMYDRIETVVFKNNEAVYMPQCSVGGTSKIVMEFSDNVLVKQVEYVCNAEQVLEETVEYNTKNGIAHHTYYFPNGRPRLICDKRYDSMEGPYTRFFESGRKAEEGVCEHGKVNGKQTLFYDNEANSIREESYLLQGILDGNCVRRKENGDIEERCTYDNGKRIIYRGMSEILFNKQADHEAREVIAQGIKDARKQGQSEKAVLLARQFHSEQSDIPRRTALKMGEGNCRS